MVEGLDDRCVGQQPMQWFGVAFRETSQLHAGQNYVWRLELRSADHVLQPYCAGGVYAYWCLRQESNLPPLARQSGAVRATPEPTVVSWRSRGARRRTARAR